MTNPLLIAAKGKGFLPMLARGRVIASQYGLTPGKMEAALTTLTDTLNQSACSATIPVTASALAANPAAINKDFLQGMELAIHGLHHVDYSKLSLEHQLDHLRQARGIFQRLGVPVTGFRCPYLRWNGDTLTALKETGFTYDSSQALAWDVVDGLPIDAYRRFMVKASGVEEFRAVRCIAEPRKPSQPPPEQLPGITEPRTKEPESLEELVCRVADELNVDVEQLACRRRDPQLVRARTEVARRAIAGGVATLSAVATRFGRAASSLSEQLCRRFKERSLAPPD